MNDLITELTLDQVLLGANEVARLLLWWLRRGVPRRGAGIGLRPRVGFFPGRGRLRPRGGRRVVVRSSIGVGGPARGLGGRLPVIGFAVVVVIVVVSTTIRAQGSRLLRATAIRRISSELARGLQEED